MVHHVLYILINATACTGTSLASYVSFNFWWKEQQGEEE